MEFARWMGLCFCFLQNLCMFKCGSLVICKGISNGTTTIGCGPDGIIQVHDVTAAYLVNRGSCGGTYILNEITSKVSWCKTSVHPRVGCHGSFVCPLSQEAGATFLRDCGATTNVIHINYSCLKMNTTAVLPLYQDVTAGPLHIFSPDFPSTMPAAQLSFSCDITAAGLASGGITRMDVTIERLRLYQTDQQCLQHLYFVVDGSNSTSLCSNTDYDLWKAELQFMAQTLTFVYEQVTSPDHGGLFWLHVRGFQGQQRVDLHITCPDQSQIPGYTTTPKSTTTTTRTTSTTTAASNKASSGPDISKEKEKGGKDTRFLAGVLSAVGLVLIVVIIVVLLILRMRKRKRNKANEEQADDTNTRTTEKSNGIMNEGSTNVRVSNEYVYSDIQEDENQNTKHVKKPKERNKKPRHEVYEDVKKNKENMYAVVDKGKKEKIQNNDNTDIGAMYAVVDKNKETKMDHIDNDETVICENDDLYEPGPNANMNGAAKNDETEEAYAVVDKEKSKEMKPSDADETLVYENDDLYEAGPIVPNNNANVDNEKDDDDEIEMYENNELYSGTEDTKNAK